MIPEYYSPPIRMVESRMSLSMLMSLIVTSWKSRVDSGALYSVEACELAVAHCGQAVPSEYGLVIQNPDSVMTHSIMVTTDEHLERND